jgi:SAM-dependent methyltransferase
MEEVPYDKWFDYIESIFEKENLKPKKVLEMACGSGNLTQYFCKKRYDTTAFDLSEDMLLLAREKIGRCPNLKLSHQNMIDFKYRQKFDSIIAVCDSINYIVEEEDLLKTFENVYNHLEEDGIFIFDVNTPYKLEHILGKNKFISEEEDCFLVWENNYEAPICKFILNIFMEVEEGLYERYEEEHLERAYEIEYLKEKLSEAGFGKIDVYEAFEMEFDDSKKIERVNFVVRK